MPEGGGGVWVCMINNDEGCMKKHEKVGGLGQKCLKIVLRHVWTTPLGYVDSGDFIFMIRPSLKIILFPVHRPGDPLSAEWVHFFKVLGIFLLFSLIFSMSFMI